MINQLAFALFCMERCHVYSKNKLIFYGFAFGSMNICYWFYCR